MKADLNKRPSAVAEARSIQAFSLVEVMCAILILGVALVGLTQGLTTALASNKESEVQTTASQIAAGLIETLRAEGGVIDGETEGDCGDALTLYSWKRTITASRIAGLHEVTLVVQSSNSKKPIYELRTMLFEVPEESDSKATEKRRDRKSQKKGRA